MATRSVRLDNEAEQALTEVTNVTGQSISESIKHGLFLYQKEIQSKRKPSSFFEGKHLEGGESLGDASNVSALLKAKLKKINKSKSD